MLELANKVLLLLKTQAVFSSDTVHSTELTVDSHVSVVQSTLSVSDKKQFVSKSPLVLWQHIACLPHTAKVQILLYDRYFANSLLVVAYRKRGRGHASPNENVEGAECVLRPPILRLWAN